jgi:ABC-type multidrug transport system permease subunit
MIKMLKKNLKVLFRNPLTVLILLFGPMLVVVIASLAFNNTAGYDIKIGVYSETYSELSNQFVSELENSFTVITHPSRYTCIDAIKSTGAHSCIVIPPDLKIEAGNTNTLELHVDESRINIVSAIKQGILESLQKTSAGISQELTGGILQALTYTEEEIVKDTIFLKEQIIKADTAITEISFTQDLVSSNKLDFNQDDLDLDVLEKNTRNLDKSFSDAKELAEDAIGEYKDTVEDIEALNSSDPQIKAAVTAGLETVSDLENDIGNLTLDGDALTAVTSVVEDITDQIAILDANLKSARNNTDIATTKMESVQENLEKSKEKLQEVSDSFGTILIAIGSNTVRDADNIVNPIEIEEFSVASGSQLQFLYPSLLLLVLMFVTIIAASTQVIGEKLDKSTLRMSMTPVGFPSRAISTFFTILLITIVQVALILIATQLVFDIDILTTILPVVAILFTATIFFTLIGMAIGYTSNSQHSGMFSAIGISSVFFVVSDLILPIESLSPMLLNIIQYTPFVLATTVLRKVMFFNASLADLQIQFYVLLGTSVTVLVSLVCIAWMIGKIRKLKARRRAKKL